MTPELFERVARVLGQQLARILLQEDEIVRLRTEIASLKAPKPEV